MWNIKQRSTCQQVGRREPVISESCPVIAFPSPKILFACCVTVAVGVYFLLAFADTDSDIGVSSIDDAVGITCSSNSMADVEGVISRADVERE